MPEHDSSSKPTVTIRPVRPEDTQAILDITAEVFGPFSIDQLIETTFGREGDGWQHIKAHAIQRELQAAPESCFVAELDGQVVGYVTNTINPAASRGTIANLAVSAAAQGRGAGRKLLEISLQRFRELGLAMAKIETLAHNDVGTHLYPTLGFQEVARQVHYAMKL